jgi:hypothetical protein
VSNQEATLGNAPPVDHQISNLPVHLFDCRLSSLWVISGAAKLFGNFSVHELQVRHVDIEDTI